MEVFRWNHNGEVSERSGRSSLSYNESHFPSFAGYIQDSTMTAVSVIRAMHQPSIRDILFGIRSHHVPTIAL